MRKIVVGYNGSDEARDALHLADRLARLEGAELQVVVAGMFEPQISTAVEEKDARAGLRVLFAGVEEELPAQPFSPHTLQGLPAARGLVAHAEDEGADLIVVGSTHRGRLGRVLPGSVGEQLLRGSPCAIAIAPRGFRHTRDRVYGVIGLAYDGSPESNLALGEAELLARLLEVDLRLISVVPELEPLEIQAFSAEARQAALGERCRVVQGAAARVGGEIDVEAVLLEGDPASVLTNCCERLDLLVIGSRGRGPLRRTLLGGVAAHVFRNAECPVVVVPRGAGRSISEPAGAGMRSAVTS